jgi:hypothetical protein
VSGKRCGCRTATGAVLCCVAEQRNTERATRVASFPRYLSKACGFSLLRFLDPTQVRRSEGVIPHLPPRQHHHPLATLLIDPLLLIEPFPQHLLHRVITRTPPRCALRWWIPSSVTHPFALAWLLNVLIATEYHHLSTHHLSILAIDTASLQHPQRKHRCARWTSDAPDGCA